MYVSIYFVINTSTPAKNLLVLHADHHMQLMNEGRAAYESGAVKFVLHYARTEERNCAYNIRENLIWSNENLVGDN